MTGRQRCAWILWCGCMRNIFVGGHVYVVCVVGGESRARVKTCLAVLHLALILQSTYVCQSAVSAYPSVCLPICPSHWTFTSATCRCRAGAVGRPPGSVGEVITIGWYHWLVDREGTQ